MCGGGWADNVIGRGGEITIFQRRSLPLACIPMLGICGLHDKTKAEATVFSLFLRDRNPVEVEVVCHGATSVNTSVVQGILHM